MDGVIPFWKNNTPRPPARPRRSVTPVLGPGSGAERRPPGHPAARVARGPPARTIPSVAATTPVRGSYNPGNAAPPPLPQDGLRSHCPRGSGQSASRRVSVSNRWEGRLRARRPSAEHAPRGPGRGALTAAQRRRRGPAHRPHEARTPSDPAPSQAARGRCQRAAPTPGPDR